MRINVNEVLLMYLDYFFQAFHSGRKVCNIVNDASNILTPDQVMIGVSESLREIKFALVAHNIPKQLFVLLKPHSYYSIRPCLSIARKRLVRYIVILVSVLYDVNIYDPMVTVLR